MDADLVAAFRRHNIETTETEIEAALLQALAEQAPVAKDAVGDLSAAEIEALESVGVNPAGTASGSQAWVRSATRHAEMVASGLPTARVAGMLGVSEGRVRQKLRDRQLFAVPHPVSGRGHLFPLFQFHQRRPLPGLAAVLRAMPRDLHPLAVRNFFLMHSPDLEGEDGTPRSPRDWLIGGGDSRAVATLVHDL